MGFTTQPIIKMLDLENHANVESDSINRYYTLTVKACKNSFKGDQQLLTGKFMEVLKDMEAIGYEYTVEHIGLPTEHFHALVLAKQYIPNKMNIYKQAKYYGFSVKMDIVRKEFQDDIVDLWLRYINKDISDSERYYKLYGNMFTEI